MKGLAESSTGDNAANGVIAQVRAAADRECAHNAVRHSELSLCIFVTLFVWTGNNGRKGTILLLVEYIYNLASLYICKYYIYEYLKIDIDMVICFAYIWRGSGRL